MKLPLTDKNKRFTNYINSVRYTYYDPNRPDVAEWITNVKPVLKEAVKHGTGHSNWKRDVIDNAVMALEFIGETPGLPKIEEIIRSWGFKVEEKFLLDHFTGELFYVFDRNKRYDVTVTKRQQPKEEEDLSVEE